MAQDHTHTRQAAGIFVIIVKIAAERNGRGKRQKRMIEMNRMARNQLRQSVSAVRMLGGTFRFRIILPGSSSRYVSFFLLKKRNIRRENSIGPTERDTFVAPVQRVKIRSWVENLLIDSTTATLFLFFF